MTVIMAASLPFPRRGGADPSPALRAGVLQIAQQRAHHHAGGALGGVRPVAVGGGAAGDVEVDPGLALDELADEERGGDRPAVPAAGALQVGNVAPGLLLVL